MMKQLVKLYTLSVHSQGINSIQMYILDFLFFLPNNGHKLSVLFIQTKILLFSLLLLMSLKFAKYYVLFFIIIFCILKILKAIKIFKKLFISERL